MKLGEYGTSLRTIRNATRSYTYIFVLRLHLLLVHHVDVLLCLIERKDSEGILGQRQRSAARLWVRPQLRGES